MKIIYFAGGNRLNTLKAVNNIKKVQVTKICVASIETNENVEKYRKFANENNIKFEVFSKRNIEKLFLKDDEEILLSVGYRFIIPPIIFNQFKYAINIHPSLLPKYKGAYSGFAIIENGEKETGITAHFIDDGIDTGDIICQTVIPLTNFDTINTMSEKISKIEPSFVSDVINSIIDNNFKTQKQININYMVYNKKRVPEDSLIDVNKPLIELYNKIRSCDQERYPAYFELEGKKIKVKLEFED